jgi:SAM-dependent methyltransferase
MRSASAETMREQEPALERIAAGEYDFLDFGCSKGGSLILGRDLFGGRRGLGIDIDAAKVAASRRAGHDALLADATNLNLATGAVSFVLMMHFLEHLPGYEAARRAIESATRVARDFVFIRHPWFDSDGVLFDLGLKFYWSDWRGHPNRFGKLDFFRVLARAKRVHRWFLLGYEPVADTRSRDIVDLHGPADSQGASAAEIAARPRNVIAVPTYRQIASLVQIDPAFDVEPVLATLRRRQHLPIYDSGA